MHLDISSDVRVRKLLFCNELRISSSPASSRGAEPLPVVEGDEDTIEFKEEEVADVSDGTS